MELLKVLSVLEPGVSNSMLNTQFELEVARILLVKRESLKIIDDHMKIITDIYNQLYNASDGKAILDTRLTRIKEQVSSY